MAANTFGRIFQVTTFGESHGSALGVVVDGAPPKIPIAEKDIQVELDRRRPGQSPLTTQRHEGDTVEILSGIFEGQTTGTPLAMLIRNQDHKSEDYDRLKDIFRPGHADFTYLKKYGIRDHRGGGRSSGRETAARVAAGAVAKKILKSSGIRIYAYTLAIGSVRARQVDLSVIERNPLRSPDMDAAEKMRLELERVRDEKDSIGGLIEGLVKGVPAGLGEPVFDKLQAQIAQALLSIGGVHGIEFGAGFKAAEMRGSQHNDRFKAVHGQIETQTNHCGGILGGISTGGDILLRLAVKPTSSIAIPQETVTVDGEKAQTEIKGRHDPCLCPRIVPVVEAMLAICLTDALLIQQTRHLNKKP